jgi:hypothetical protein
MTERMRIAINFVGFQLAWFACVLGGARGWQWLGPALVVLLTAWHLKSSCNPLVELRLLLIGSMLGIVFDQILLTSGWIDYPSASVSTSSWPNWLLPPWMMALWLIFCTTLNVSMRWLRAYPMVAVLFGAIGGPLAYWSGAKLGAMIWLQPLHATIALALGWAVLMPLLVKLASIHDGNLKA